MDATAGTLFFDGACGMCTRSKDLLLKFDRTGKIRTEPLQGP
jgi:predicted DCC family thiol-disulfide oxidoreductase YuxK